MTTKQYIGARYVPIFGRVGEDTIEWDNTKAYEPLTIVLHEGNSYTSKQYVPVGAAITNTAYWAETGNFNAQVEAYRRDVLGISSDISEEIENRAQADSALQSDINAIEANIDPQTTNGFGTAAYRDATANLISGSNALLTSGAAYNKFNQIEQEISEIGTSNAIVFIGDSYMDGSTNGRWVSTWCDDVAEALNATAFKYYDRGAGWATTGGRRGSTFLTQCQEAAANNAIKAFKNIAIIVYGGVNDVNTGKSASTVRTNMEAGISALTNAFPTAKIYVAGINVGKSNIESRNWVAMFNVWQEVAYAAAKNVTFYKALGWLCSDNITYAADALHPVGAHGNDILKVKWISILQGSEVKFTCVDNDPEIPTTTYGNKWMDRPVNTGTMLCCEGHYKFIGSINSDFSDFNANGEPTNYVLTNRSARTFSKCFGLDNIASAVKLESFNRFTNKPALPFLNFYAATNNKVIPWYESGFGQATSFVPDSESYNTVSGEWDLF